MQDKKQEKLHFDEFTSEDTWSPFTEGTYNKIVRLFITLTKPQPEENIIDMGCGTGELAAKIQKKTSNEVRGFDISENCIAMAQKNFPEVDFVVKDIEKTGLQNDSVDILFYCGVLHHFPDFQKVIQEAKRILKKGGKLFVFEPNTRNPVLWLFRSKDSPIKSNKLKSPNEEFLTKKQVKKAFMKEDMNIVEVECISGISYTQEHFKKLFPFPLYYINIPYNMFESLLNMTPLRKEFGSFIYGCFEKP